MDFIIDKKFQYSVDIKIYTQRYNTSVGKLEAVDCMRLQKSLEGKIIVIEYDIVWQPRKNRLLIVWDGIAI